MDSVCEREFPNGTLRHRKQKLEVEITGAVTDGGLVLALLSLLANRRFKGLKTLVLIGFGYGWIDLANIQRIHPSLLVLHQNSLPLHNDPLFWKKRDRRTVLLIRTCGWLREEVTDWMSSWDAQKWFRGTVVLWTPECCPSVLTRTWSEAELGKKLIMHLRYATTEEIQVHPKRSLFNSLLGRPPPFKPWSALNPSSKDWYILPFSGEIVQSALSDCFLPFR